MERDTADITITRKEDAAAGIIMNMAAAADIITMSTGI